MVDVVAVPFAGAEKAVSRGYSNSPVSFSDSLTCGEVL